jgi:hypothetical protein
MYVYPYEMGPCHHCMERPQVVVGDGLCMHAHTVFWTGKETIS